MPCLKMTVWEACYMPKKCLSVKIKLQLRCSYQLLELIPGIGKRGLVAWDMVSPYGG